MGELVINDRNWLKHRDMDVEIFARGLNPRTDWSMPEFCGPPDFDLVPRVAWPDLIADMERDRTRLSDIAKDCGIPVLNQGDLPYCHAYSPALAAMVLEAYQGKPFAMLSPGSIGGPATGYRRRGAWIIDDLRVITERGIAETRFVPEKQVSRNGWKPGAEANALEHTVLEWYDLPRTQSFDRMITLLLNRVPVCTGHNWWGHAVTAFDPWCKKSGGRWVFGARFRNSWGPGYGEDGWFVMEEGKGTPDESYAPRVMSPVEEVTNTGSVAIAA